MAANANNMLWLAEISKSFSLKWLNPNCKWMIIGMSFTKFLFFYADRKSKMATIVGHRLTLDPMGKFSNAKSSQKLQIWLKPNCTWMFIGWSSTYFRFFVPIWNSKWRLRQDLVLDHMGKMFQNASSLKPLGQLKPNCPGIIIWRSSKKKIFLCRSKIQDGCHHRQDID